VYQSIINQSSNHHQPAIKSLQHCNTCSAWCIMTAWLCGGVQPRIVTEQKQAMVAVSGQTVICAESSHLRESWWTFSAIAAPLGTS